MTAGTDGRDTPAAPPAVEDDAQLPDGLMVPDLDYPTVRLSLVAKLMDRLTLRQLAGQGQATYAEWRVLGRLASLPDGGTVGQIADLAWVDRAEVSRAATALERRGLVRRSDNLEDRRKPMLHITAQGRKVHRPLADDRRAFHAALVEDLSEEERQTLDRLLGKIARRLFTQLRSGGGG